MEIVEKSNENSNEAKLSMKEKYKDLFQVSKSCHICWASFSMQKHLMIHFEKEHTGQSPYKCFDCNESFPKKKYLKKHVLYVHEGDNANAEIIEESEKNVEESYTCYICKASSQMLHLYFFFLS